MLEGLSHIPVEEQDYSYSDSALIIDAIAAVRKYIPKSAKGRALHTRSDTVSYLLQLAHAMDGIFCADTDYSAYSRYYTGDKDRFLQWTDGSTPRTNIVGIFVNEEAKTHYSEADFPYTKRMPLVEDNLRQTPGHFLRVFTSNFNKVLYVWTNKPLLPTTLYKLKQLQHEMDRKLLEVDKPYVTDFYNALANADLEGVVKAVNDFFESDLVKENEFRIFKECVTYNINQRIESLEYEISKHRQNIYECERRIADMSTQIRDDSDTIMMLKNKDQSEDIKILHKYLKNHPYIKKFEAKEDGILALDYIAPLIYFNEFAVEKIMKNYHGDFERNVLNLFLSNRFQLYTACKLNFSTSNFRVGIENTSNTDYFPHPHIDRYHCFGNHQTGISESAVSGDFLGAIEQISQAVLNLNFYDGCVINTMLRNLRENYTERKTWYDKTTGELLDTDEAIERYKNETTQTNN